MSVLRHLSVVAVALVLALAAGGRSHAAVTFTYDNLGRLTQAAYTSGATITYAYDALGNRTTVSVTGVPGIAVVSGTPQLAALNTAFDQPLKVKVTDAQGTGVADKAVTITVPGAGTGASCTAPALTDANGITQTTCTANGVAGTYAVSVTTAGVNGAALFILTNYQGATGTSVTLTASPDPAVFASTTRLTAVVTGNAPGGTVNFLIGGASIFGCSAVPLVNGIAICDVDSLPFGNSNLSAVYSGDGQNAGGQSSILALLVSIARGMPDTGQDKCYDTANEDVVGPSDPASIARDGAPYPRQDCRYGRDPAAAAGAFPKVGGGVKGRDYTKIANNGAAVDASASLGTGTNDWACTRDNVTGLTWEVKTDTPGSLRYRFHAYTWYDTNPSTNGGGAGSPGTDTCTATLPNGQCNTQAYVAAVNAAGLCGASDWRLPSLRELLTLQLFHGPIPLIDTDYFPNTGAEPFWSSTPNSRAFQGTFDSAWEVDFLADYRATGKSRADRVRLVRGTGF